MNAQPTSASPFEEPVARAETRLQNWIAEVADCRQKLTAWEELRPVVVEKCREYRDLSRDFAAALREARRVTRVKFPEPASFWDRVPGRWLSLRWNWIRLEIALLAVLIFLRWLLIRLLLLAVFAALIVAVVWLALQLYGWAQGGGFSGGY